MPRNFPSGSIAVIGARDDRYHSIRHAICETLREGDIKVEDEFVEIHFYDSPTKYVVKVETGQVHDATPSAIQEIWISLPKGADQMPMITFTEKISNRLRGFQVNVLSGEHAYHAVDGQIL